jgi:hypothetical protein
MHPRVSSWRTGLAIGKLVKHPGKWCPDFKIGAGHSLLFSLKDGTSGNSASQSLKTSTGNGTLCPSTENPSISAGARARIAVAVIVVFLAIIF